MKTLKTHGIFIIWIVLLGTLGVIQAQAPQKMSYQAVIRDGGGQLVTNSNIGIQVSILQGSSEGTVVYVERHLPTTNENGLVSLHIGDGNVESGSMDDINWEEGPYFIHTETDLDGGTNYTLSHTSELLSVPYALFAKTFNGHADLLSRIDALEDAVDIDDPVSGSVTDIDGNVYPTVIIGNQTWMAENLKTTHYRDGTPIDNPTSNSDWQSNESGAYAWYDNDITWKDSYGALYNWYAVNNTKGLCPEGWVVPSHVEWIALTEEYLGGYFVAGGKLKSTRTEPDSHPRWDLPNAGATNETGFSALPGSQRMFHGGFADLPGYHASIWTSTKIDGEFAWSRFLMSTNAGVQDYTGSRKGSGRSVRCIESVASADFTGNPTSGIEPLTVSFTDHSLNSPTSWQWSFGDGNTSTEQNPQHTYENPGTYTVELTIENNYSTDTKVKTEYITVIDAPDIIYGDGVKDIDGNDYVTVKIGSQEWMAEDLRVTRYNNGDEIPTGLDNTDWANTSFGAYAIYPYEYVAGIFSDEEMVEAYGKLYNWYAVDDARGLCPIGWSVPSYDDWTQLIDYVVAQGYPNNWANDDSAGNALKSCRQVGSPLSGDCDTSVHPRWGYDDTHFGFDEFGLSLLPGGFRRDNGAFSSIGYVGDYWSSSGNATTAWSFFILHDWGSVWYSGQNPKNGGRGIRCIKD